MTSTFEHGNPDGFDYTRSGNPNFKNLEARIGALEQAQHATVFSSGVGAMTAVLSTLSAGDRVLAEENLYGCTYRLFEQVYKKFGIEFVYADLSEESGIGTIPAVRPTMVWLESPTNPLLKILDIERIADAAQRAGATVVVDNTFASSYLQQPLVLGATLSLSSTTKYLNGHADCIGGVVCTNDTEWGERLVFAQKALGLNPSPFDSWLITRGVQTLPLRMAAHCENAEWLAERLERHPAFTLVRHPSLPSHPQHDLAKRQMKAGSAIIVAELALGIQETRRFLESLELFTLAESLGGVESLVCHPASMTHASVPSAVRQRVGISDSLVRFSVGIEHRNDLFDDLQNALRKVSL